MTFDEFQALCDSATATGVAVKSPCPITIGDPAASVKATYGELNRELVVFREKPNNAALKSIVHSVQFSYDAAGNETVITPLITGT